MPSQLEPAAPKVMQADIAQLCARVRAGEEVLYGRLLRENILGVITCSFPAFSRRAGADKLAAWVDAFIGSHAATLPSFHQIASEFLLFAQSAPDFSAALMPVVEYEWVLLDVEIDPACVKPAPAAVCDIDTLVTLNPTLRLLMLPFDATGEEWPMQDQPMPHAVWRNGAHGIVTRALSREDCLLIDQLRESAPTSPGDLARHVVIDPPGDVTAWIHAALSGDLLCLAPRKEAQS